MTDSTGDTVLLAFLPPVGYTIIIREGGGLSGKSEYQHSQLGCRLYQRVRKTSEINPKAAFQYLCSFGGIELIQEHYETEHLLSLDDAVEDLGIMSRNNGGSL
jgi:hypothetical protein